MQKCQKGHLIFKETCRACKDLKAEWYTHLNNQGFEDIERGSYLKESDLAYRRQIKDPDLFKAKQNYYTWAQGVLETANFESIKDKLIWESHAEGLSQREIAPRVGIGQPWVARKLKQIEGYLKETSLQIQSSISSYMSSQSFI